VVLEHWVGHLAVVAGPAADLGVLAARPAVAAGLPHSTVVVGLDWPEVVAAVGVAADLLSLLLAWLPLPVLVPLQLAVWLLWPLLWLQCWQLCWLLLLLLVWLMLHAAGVLSLCLIAIRFGPVLELELSRGASDYVKPPSVLWKRIWINGHLDCQAGSLVQI